MTLNPRLDHHAVRDHAVLGDDDDAIADVVIRMVHLVGLAGGGDDDVVADPRVLVHDGVFDAGVGADADGRLAGLLVLHYGFDRFIEIAAEQYHPVQHRSHADAGAQADDTVRDDSDLDNAAVGNDRMIDLGAVDFRARQKARAAEDRRGHVKEVEARQFVRDIDVGLEEGANGSNVLPIALEHKGEHAQILNSVGDNMFAKIGERVVQQAADDVAVEDVDAHGRHKQIPFALDPQRGIPFRREFQRILDRRLLGFLDEARNASLGIDLHDPQSLRLAPSDGYGRHRDVGPRFRVLVDHAAKVHSVQCVAAEDEEVVPLVIHEVNQVLADGIGGALIPGRVGVGLLGGEDFHEPAGKVVELVGLRDVLVQGGGVEHGQQVNTSQAGVDAVGDGDIDQTILAGQRYGRFGALLCQREQACALPAAQDDRKHVAGVGGLPAGI